MRSFFLTLAAAAVLAAGVAALYATGTENGESALGYLIVLLTTALETPILLYAIPDGPPASTPTG